MLSPVWLWIVLFVLPALAAVRLYNLIIRQRNRVREAWSGIDVQLKRRHELIPRLVEVTRAYASHELATLRDTARVRTNGTEPAGLRKAEKTEQEISRRLRPLLALAEAYPDLKADESFLQLQRQLVEVEDFLQMARRYYNGTVRDFNNLVEAFPGSVVAALFRFRPLEFFEIELATERLAPAVDVGNLESGGFADDQTM